MNLQGLDSLHPQQGGACRIIGFPGQPESIRASETGERIPGT